MPLTADAKKVMSKFKDQYGAKKGKSVYYATANKQGRSERTFKKASDCSILTAVLAQMQKNADWRTVVERQVKLRDQLLKQAGIRDLLASMLSGAGRGGRAAGSGIASGAGDVYELLRELVGAGGEAAQAVGRHPYSAAGLGAVGLGGYAGARLAAREPEEEIDPQLAALIAQEQGL